MKKTLLIITCITSISINAQTTQLITSEAYSVLKKNGQLDNNVTYLFPNNSVAPVNSHLSRKDIPSGSEKIGRAHV